MTPAGIDVRGPAVSGGSRILTDDALAFVADLQRRFGAVRHDLLQRRQERQVELDAGVRPGFLLATHDIREDPDWRGGPPPPHPPDPAREITGPGAAKVMVN